MPLTLFPIGKIMHVCDEVIADPLTKKPSLLNLWEVVRIPHGGSFPYTLGKLCVAALMRDGEGEARFRADVVRADTIEVVRRSQDFRVRFTDRRGSTSVVIRLKDITFPAPGAYLVELFCEGRSSTTG
jgi:hypothetical protein